MPNNYSVVIRAMEGKSGSIPDKRNYKIVFRNTKRTEEVSSLYERKFIILKNILSMDLTSN